MKSDTRSGFSSVPMPKENPMPQVKLTIDSSDYLTLIKMIEKGIRSERARVRAFRHLGDRSNAHMAEGTHDGLLHLHDAVTNGCAPDGGADD